MLKYIRTAASARETLTRRSDVRYAEPDEEMRAIGAAS